MILGLGLDIVEISRIKKIYYKSCEQFLKRIFTKNEIKQFNDFNFKDKQDNFLAKRFAAKEAFAKAVGIGIGKVKFTDIEIYNNNNGKPEIRKTSKINQLIEELFAVKNYQINLSISDDAGIAQAIIIISKNDN